ncbi:MAG: carboxypeptidase-like regulatory domain-containing protein [Acidobacteriota bacterium]
MIRWSLLLALVAVAQAQQAPFEIRGTVAEPGLGGIAGAEITASLAISFLSKEKPVVLRGNTDSRGGFVLRTETPGTYLIEAQLNGYDIVLESFRRSVTVDAEHPQGGIAIRLIRPGKITGRVLDAETRQPVKGFRVQPVQRLADGKILSGVAIPLASKEMLEQMSREIDASRGGTDEDGIFTFTWMPPGDYLVFTRLGVAAAARSENYSPEDLKSFDESYEATYWPGGGSLENAIPMHLGSGGYLNVGDILLRKTQQYRIHVSLPQGECPEGESIRLSAFRRGSQSVKGPQLVRCGGDVLLPALDPGSYMLYAVSDWQGERDNPENAVWGLMPVEVVDKNLEVTVDLRRGVIVDGQLIAVEGMMLPDSIPMGVQPGDVFDGQRPAGEQVIAWDANGRFRMVVSARPNTLVVVNDRNNLSYFVKELRYNGSILPNFTIPVNPGAQVHRLDIVLDNKFGRLEVSSNDGNRDFLVLLAKEGADRVTPMNSLRAVFQATLPPGEYHVLAVRSFSESDSVARVLKEGQKVTLRPGETVHINVRVSSASN